MKYLRPTRMLIVPVSVLVFGSCSGGDQPAAPVTVAVSVQVSPGADTLVSLGQTRQLTATVKDAAGNTLGGRTVAWSSNAGGVATVNTANGLVTAVGNGGATITATADGVSGTAQVVVAQLVTTVTVTPGNTGLTGLGLTQPFTAVAKDAGGATVPTPRFIWISSDPAVAVVDSLGIATSKRSGQTTITAAAQGIPGNALLSVSQTATQLGYRVSPPVSTVAGEAFARAVQVEIRDAGGAVVADAQLPVILTATGGTLHGTTEVNAINGIASFSGLWMENTGAGFTLSASSGALPAAMSSAFAITSAAPVSLAYTHAPASDTAGAHLAVVVRIRDRYGNTVSSAGNQVRVHLVANPAVGELFGDTAVVAVAGVATFATLNLHKAGGGYTLRATSVDLDSTLSPPFAVSPASASKVDMGPDVGARVNAPIGPDIQFMTRDVFGNLSGAHPITVTLAGIPWPPAHLQGALTQTTVAGVATFTDLTVDRPANGFPGDPYLLIGSAPGIESDTANLFIGWNAGLVDLGSRHSCAIAGFGSPPGVLCWGANGLAQLGNAELGALDSVPAPAVATLSPAALTAGDTHSCVLTYSQAAHCWGDNAAGQLGGGTTGGTQSSPATVTGGHTWLEIAAGGSHTCGISAADSTAYCWGDNGLGQLGDNGAPTDRNAPTAVNGGRQFFGIAAGFQHTCAIQVADSAAYCWGRGAEGQLGQGVFSGSNVPVLVSGGHEYAGLATGDNHTCGVLYDYITTNVHCWGLNGSGQLGNDNAPTNAAAPVPTAKAPFNFDVVIPEIYGLTSIRAGTAHTCVQQAVSAGGHILCWGDNGEGQIGPAGGSASDVPVIAMSGLTFSFSSVAAGGNHSCADAPGSSSAASGLYCWGRNLEGQLGDGSRTGGSTPKYVVQ